MRPKRFFFVVLAQLIFAPSVIAADNAVGKQYIRNDDYPCITRNGKKARPPSQTGFFLGGERFASASILSTVVSVDEYTDDPVLILTFDRRAGKRLEQMTARNVGFAMPVFLDGKLLTCPMVNERITGDAIQLSGGFSRAEVEKLAAKIKPTNK